MFNSLFHRVFNVSLFKENFNKEVAEIYHIEDTNGYNKKIKKIIDMT